MSEEVAGTAVSIACLAVAARLLLRSNVPAGWRYGARGPRAVVLMVDGFGETSRLDLVDWSVNGNKLRGKCRVSGRVRTITTSNLRAFHPL